MGCNHSSLAEVDEFAFANSTTGLSEVDSGYVANGGGLSNKAGAYAAKDVCRKISGLSSEESYTSGICGVQTDSLTASGKSDAGASWKPKLRTDCKVHEAYLFAKTLGTGGFSIVKLVVKKTNLREWACKVMELPTADCTTEADKQTRDNIFKEIDIMCCLEHENIVGLKEYFMEGKKIYLITDLLLGGDMLDALHTSGRFTEEEARMCLRQLLQALQYVHSRGIMHRDIKLENLLLAKKDDLSSIKIADFGLAKLNWLDDKQSVCGTPQFVAPEVISGARYDTKVDLWSAGVVLYTLLSGFLPFHSDNRAMLFDQIRRADFDFCGPEWSHVSGRAKDLICKLLVVDPAKRLTATEALQHEWLSGPAPKGRRVMLDVGDFTPCDDVMDYPEEYM